MWHLNFFGGLRASSQDRVVERFRTQKTAALLALLALRGARSREDVCALLWPDASPEAARNSLSAALSALRRDLGDDIVRADRTTVSLVPSLYETDVAAFSEALKANDLSRAVELYRGHLLPGFHEDPFPALEREWEEKARTAFNDRLEELEQNGQSVELLELARRSIALFGDDERWFLSLMRAHYGLGDLDAALRAYDSLGRFMRKNGDSASESARVLAKLIRRDKERKSVAPPPALPPLRRAGERETSAQIEAPKATEPEVEALRNNLPTQWTRFFGREGERALLRSWLLDGQKLVTLSGAGGSGKTRLSLETLREIAPNWKGDLVFVPLAPLSDPELILPAIRDALQLTGTPDLSPLEQIERALRGRSALLYLDNFEQLVEGGAARLQALRERLPQATFLITSRVLLQLPGEREFPVSPLPTPLRNTAPAQVREYASAALFCDRSGLVIDASNAEAVGALCRRLDGIPLALELAAARARVLSPSQILERLQKHPDFLQSRELGVPARHKTLRATIEWSTDLLPPELREFWTRLSLFHGGWTLEAAEKIAAPGICEDWETLDWLTLLRECSLIFIEESGESSRFRMLQTLREFGREQLVRTDEVERAFFDFYLDLAQQAASAMQGPGQTAWLARLDAEQDNLRAALTYARDSEPERGLLLATALIDFWETRLSLDEGRGWIETFLRATATPTIAEKPALPKNTLPAQQTTPLENGNGDMASARVRALSGAGRLASHSIELAESRALVEQGLDVARQSGDTSNFVYAVSSFVRFAMTSGEVETDMARAKQLSHDAVRMARETGDKSLLAEALTSLGYIRISLADLNGLRAVYEEAIALLRGLKDEARLSRLLSSLAHLCYHEKKWDEANALLDESTPIARRLTSPWELLEALWVRSHVAREQGNLALARAAITEEWEMCRDNLTLLWARSMNMAAIAYLRIREGDPVGATRIFGAEEALRETSNFNTAPIIHIDYTRYCDEARRVLGEARFQSLWQEGRLLPHQEAVDAALYGEDSQALMATRARALSGAGRLAWHDSDFGASRDLVEQGLEAARKSGDLASFVYAAAAFERFAMTTGDVEGVMDRARQLCTDAVRRARESNEKHLLLEALIAHGFATLVVSRLREAGSAVKEAIALARTLRDEHSLVRALTLAARIAYHEGHLADARVLIEDCLPVCQRLGSTWDLISALWVSSCIAREQDDLDRSHADVVEAMQICRAHPQFRWGVANLLLTMSHLLVKLGQNEMAVQLMGATQALWNSVDYHLIPVLLDEYQRYQSQAREALGTPLFQKAWQQGLTLSPEAALDVALNLEITSPPDSNVPLAVRSRALSGAGRMAWYASDLENSETLLRQGLDAARRSGDASLIANAARSSALGATAFGDATRARELGRESVRLAREAGDDELLFKALTDLGLAEINISDFAAAEAVCREAVALARKQGNERVLATALVTLAIAYNYLKRYEEARVLIAESESLARRQSAVYELMVAVSLRGHISSAQGLHAEARAAFHEALTMARTTINGSWTLVNMLLSVAYGFSRRGDARGCALILGGCEALAQNIGYELMPFLLSDYEHFRAQSRLALGDTEWERQWQIGRLWTPDQMIDFALSEDTGALVEPDENLTTRARALSGAGRLAWHDNDFVAAHTLVEQGLEAARKSGDLASFVDAVAAFVRLSSVSGDIEGDIARGCVLAEEALRRARAHNDEALLAESLISLFYGLMIGGELKGVRPLIDEAIDITRKIGDELQLSVALTSLGTLAYHEGRYTESRQLTRESEEICRRLNSDFNLYASLWCTSHAAREQEDFDAAHRAIIEILELCRDNPAFRWSVSNALLSAGCLLVRLGDVAGGVQVMSTAQSLAQRSGYQLLVLLRLDLNRYRQIARELLDEATFNQAWQDGERQTFNKALDFAFERLNNPIPPDPSLAMRANELSRDERFVASARELNSAQALLRQAMNAARTSNDSPAAPGVSPEIQAARARALSGAGRLAWYASDMQQANSLLEQGLSASREMGDTQGIVYATRGLTRTAAATGDSARSLDVARESLALARASNDSSLLTKALLDQGFAAINVGDLKSAAAFSSEATALARQTGDEAALSLAINIGAIALSYEGQDEEALALIRQGEEIARRIGSIWDLLVVLALKGHSLGRLGENDASRQAFNECLTLCRESFAESWTVANSLLAAAYTFMRRGEVRDATQIMAAADAMRQRIGYEWMPIMVSDYEHFIDLAQHTLGETEFATTWRLGASMTPDEVFDFAIRPLPTPTPPTPSSPPSTPDVDETSAARSRALNGAARLAAQGSDIESSRALVAQGLDAARELGDLESFVYAVAAHVRFSMMTGDSKGVIAQSRILSAEAVARSRRENNKALLLDSLLWLGYSTCLVGLFKGSLVATEEAIALARELDDETHLVRALNNQVNIYYHQGIYPPARIILEETEALSRRLNSPADLISSLWGLSSVAREQDELELSERAMKEILEICRANPAFRWGISNILASASYNFIKRHDSAKAVRLMAASQAINESHGYQTIPVLLPDLERYKAQAQQMLGQVAFNAAWQEGRVLSIDAAIELALRPAEGPPQADSSLSNEVLSARSRALSGAGRLAWHGSDLEASRLLVNQGLEAARASGDTASFVYAVAAFVRFAMVTGDLKGFIAQSRLLSEEAVARSRRAGDKALLLDSLISLGYANTIVSQFREAYTTNEEAIALARELGDDTNLIRSLNNQASVYYHQGIYPPARIILEESEALCRRLNSTWDLIAARWTLSSVAREQGDLQLADEAISEVLEICRANPSFRWGVSNVLMTVSYLFIHRDDPCNAVRLMSASQAISDLLSYHPVPVLLVEFEQYKAKAREHLGEPDFTTAWEEGRVLSIESAIELALHR